MGDRKKTGHDRDESIDVKERTTTGKPRLYRVILHNDDYTTMEFVVFVLMELYNKSRTEATQIMLQVHHRGVGVAGVYPKDQAETKVAEVTAEARVQGMPLMLSLEQE